MCDDDTAVGVHRFSRWSPNLGQWVKVYHVKRIAQMEREHAEFKRLVAELRLDKRIPYPLPLWKPFQFLSIPLVFKVVTAGSKRDDAI